LEVTVRPALAGFPYIAAGQRSPEEAALAVSSGEVGPCFGMSKSASILSLAARLSKNEMICGTFLKA
jgi:hypothetical protein